MAKRSVRHPETLNGIPVLHARTRKQWRQWLQKNHGIEKSIWLVIYHKKSATPSIYYDEAVEEALCFGWVDSKAMKVDEESYHQYFTRRKPKSRWSKINRERVERMIKERLMTPAGQAVIDIAKNNGTWEALYDIENSVIPDDLKKSFDKNKKAFENFQRFSPSSQRLLLEWILMAKRPETRMKRIDETVEKAAHNLKAYP